MEHQAAVQTQKMPKKNRKTGKKKKRELKFEEDGQDYAQVLRMLGNDQCEVCTIDGIKRIGHITGKLGKIASGDIILVGLRDSQEYDVDVIWKYTPSEVRLLKNCGKLPETSRVCEILRSDGTGDEEIDDYIEFEDEEIDNIRLI